MKDYLDHPNIVLEKIEDVKASYGVIISGETKILKQCVSRYAREKQQEILEKITANQHLFQVKLEDILWKDFQEI